MRHHEQRQRWHDEGDDRIRVLLECAPSDSPSIIASTIERDGYAVRTCNGPGDVRCDLDRHGACALVDGADVVVNLLNGPEAAALTEQIATARRPPAVVVQTRDGSTPGTAGSHVVAVRAPATRRSLLDGIRTALAGADIEP